MDGTGMDSSLDELAKVDVIIIAAVILVMVLSCTICCSCIYLKKGRKKSELDESIILEIPSKKKGLIFPMYNSVKNQIHVINESHKFSNGAFNGLVLPATFLPPSVAQVTPKVTFRVLYSSQCDATAMGRLTVHVFGAENVPARDYPLLPDSFIKILVVQKRWTLSRHENVVHEVQTRVVKANNCPVFDQNFTFAASEDDVKVWSLKIGLWDEDKYARCREICQTKIDLRDVKKYSENLPIELEPVSYKLGEALVSLSYLPTAQRLSVNIVKACNLNWKNISSSVTAFCPGVRIYLLDHSGRLIKRKKLSGFFSTDCTIFNGNAIFLTPALLLETSTILIQFSRESVLKNCELERDVGCKKNVIGFIALGWMVRNDSGREHWRAALKNPRRVLSQWHPVR